MKILAMYLPQFHEIEENNKWWGESYTEWSAVKNALPLFKEHEQPKVPLNNNYYDLSDISAKTWKWQAELANKYGVYGFCVYNYWFKGKQLLEKPLEILLKNPEIDINYCMCWANESWTKTWYGLENQILMKQDYGQKLDWLNHFNYMLPYFQDKRYIKIDNKPVLNIYRTYDIKELKEMLEYWSELSKEHGFNGIYIVSGNTNGKIEGREELVDAFYNFEPGYTLKHKLKWYENIAYNSKIWIRTNLNIAFKTQKLERIVDARLINKAMFRKDGNLKKPVFRGAFPMWDNTPRRSYKGMVYSNTTVKIFELTLEKIKNELKNSNTTDNFVYVNAWNEWGEGCYLEPDELYRYKYLEIIKKVLEN